MVKRRRRSRRGSRLRLGPLLWKVLLALSVLFALFLIYLDAVVSTTFRERRWEIPAKVYARPLELYPGLALGIEDVEYELELLGYRKSQKPGHPGERARSGRRLSLYTRPFEFPDETVAARQVELEFAGDRVSARRCIKHAR